MQFLTIRVSANIYHSTTSDAERSKAFEKLMSFPRKKVPPDFDYKKELMEAVDERFGSIG
jgi:hypothetical protein